MIGVRAHKKPRKARKPRPTIKRLHQFLTLDPATGILTWKARAPDQVGAGNQSPEANCKGWNKKWAGKRAFTATRYGYHVGSIDRTMLEAHRVIYAMHHGVWPEGLQIDHINGDRKDNRVSNLRAVPQADNTRNKAPLRKGCLLGIYRPSGRNQWHAAISRDDRRVHLGTFDCFWHAVIARKAAEKALGFHENHGRMSRFIASESAA